MKVPLQWFFYVATCMTTRTYHWNCDELKNILIFNSTLCVVNENPSPCLFRSVRTQACGCGIKSRNSVRQSSSKCTRSTSTGTGRTRRFSPYDIRTDLVAITDFLRHDCPNPRVTFMRMRDICADSGVNKSPSHSNTWGKTFAPFLYQSQANSPCGPQVYQVGVVIDRRISDT